MCEVRDLHNPTPHTISEKINPYFEKRNCHAQTSNQKQLIIICSRVLAKITDKSLCQSYKHHKSYFSIKICSMKNIRFIRKVVQDPRSEICCKIIISERIFQLFMFHLFDMWVFEIKQETSFSIALKWEFKS
jgi:hypothetical protein